MVTFAQAQERAERWVNGGVPTYQRREVWVREFGLGFVAWAEDRADGPSSGGGRQRLVIARDSGESTLWPALPVGEVIRRYEEEYGASAAPAPAAPPRRVDLEATSFLLTPPQWLQEAADRLGVPGRREAAGSGGSGRPSGGSAPVPDAPASAGEAVSGSDSGSGSPWDAADTSGSGGDLASARPPVSVSVPPISGSDDEDGGPGPVSGAGSEAKTALLPESGGVLPRTAVAPAADDPQGSARNQDQDQERQPSRSPRTPPGGVHRAATMPADPSAGGPGTPPPAAPGAPPPPGAPGVPGDAAGRAPKRGGASVPPPGEPGVPGAASPGGPSGGAAYTPTRLVSADGVASQGRADTPAPGAPAAPGGGVHHAATMPAGPGGPGGPPTGGPGGPPGAPSYGGPGQRPSGMPMVGPGYMAVLRYRAPDGSEQQLIRRSAPGTPHPEWQILHELRAMGVPPQRVLELHTELECCDVPGGYCARMVRESWPQVRISHTAPYGRDVASRQQGVRHLIEHQGELHQVADGPARPAPVRVPLPPPHLLQPAPAVGPDGVAQELAQAFGPQAVFRFDQRAVSRQGVPDVVAQTLMWAGLPVEFGPFFWVQAQPGRPVPTLAELARERGALPSADAASYLVMGNDYGRQLCVRYGTAHIMAVPLEAPAGGGPAAAQFVNSGLPQFVRSLALLGRMWRLRYGLTPEQAGRWTVDFQGMLACLDPAALAGPENWWSVLLEQMWDGLL
ncbi:SUKH-4 family immunity protein [Streptomyces sp. CNQ085]|uniref:SUKH-4 family immunity protein n=1 Tax=Streptomyces sp. CNQ085 TaxID=2886944 RepID=UPI001F5112E6|nr:SUKH-4 family immunity protein [Streptomyces sp. CNQ085]MCI0384011.1 SUKH-4 family immunity protein [Streptomyces sp. CNQ085]